MILVLFTVLAFAFAQPMTWYHTSSPFATCNDGSKAGFYYRQGASDVWIIHLQGGGFCFSQESCDSRYKNSPGLMSSTKYSKTRSGSGILSTDPNVNRHFHSATHVYIPYCSSDSFSGNNPKSDLGYAFMGSAIVESIFQDLLQIGLNNASTVIFSGSSAGAEGLYPNAVRVAGLLSPKSKLLLLIDSGWFLDFEPFRKGDCSELTRCTEQGALILGVPHWQPKLNEACSKAMSQKDQYKCMLGPHVYPFISHIPSFVMEFGFDAAGLGHDGMGLPTSPAQLAYAQAALVNLTKSFADNKVHTLFNPACYHHTVIEDGKWHNLQVAGMYVDDAIFRWSQDQTKAQTWRDACNTPNCNPTCKLI